jgi:hypothetical protein
VIVLDAAILTGDHDFLGCGCATWTVETLLAEPAGRAKGPMARPEPCSAVLAPDR